MRSFNLASSSLSGPSEASVVTSFSSYFFTDFSHSSFISYFSSDFSTSSFSCSATLFLTFFSSEAASFFITTLYISTCTSFQQWQLCLPASSSPSIFSARESSHRASCSSLDIACIFMWIQRRRNRTKHSDNQLRYCKDTLPKLNRLLPILYQLCNNSFTNL